MPSIDKIIAKMQTQPNGIRPVESESEAEACRSRIIWNSLTQK